jgi:acyl transferase domain-containing protein/phosphopantetheinyl transferase
MIMPNQQSADKHFKGPGEVAIIGMACVFPNAPNLQTYWQNIVSKVDAITDPPEDGLINRVFDPHSTANDRIYCKKGGYLADLPAFDSAEFGIMPVAVDGAEPEHFMALRVAHEALIDAGFPEKPFNRERTEVILGRGTFVNRGYIGLLQRSLVVDQTISILSELHPEYAREELQLIKEHIKAGLPPFNAETASGLAPSVMSGLIANRLDLRGRNFIVDAACASGLIALEMGVRDLLSGGSDVALVGAVQISTPSPIYMLFTQLGALSRHSQLRPFDKDADGTILGEGIGMVVLKRLEDAERDGHRIYAVVKGVGSSSDGRAKGVLAPRREGEALALRRAYEISGISPTTIGLVEAHGTGLPVGDVTEMQALREVFGSREEGKSPSCALGTVKSMIGHLIPAASIAGLIKTALALYHKTLPPTLNFEKPNPKLEIEKTSFYINTETRPWIHGIPDFPRRAGVNAFGFGGINAHAVLEEYTGRNGSENQSLDRKWDTELCIFAGESRQDLIERAERVHAFLLSSPEIDIKDLAFTLNSEIVDKPCRLAIVGSSLQEISRKLAHGLQRLKDPSYTRIKERSGIYFFQEPLIRQGKLAFIFPGEGSQYPNMLDDLCIHFPEVRYCFDLVNGTYSREGDGHLLNDYLFPPPTGLSDAERKEQEKYLWQMEGGVQSVGVASWALCRLFSCLNVEASAVMGHSSGEFGALKAARAIKLDTEEDLMQHIIAGRKSLKGVAAYAEKLPEAMLVAISVDDRSILNQIVGESQGALTISMDNCPHQIIMCGSPLPVNDAIDKLRAAGVRYTALPLPFNRPYHTAVFKAACGPLKEFFASLEIVRPEVPIYSGATATVFPDNPDGIRELAVSQWSLPVRFRETIESMYEDGIRIFLEVGPKANLTSFVDDILGGRHYIAVPSHLQQRSGISQLHHALGMLAAHGVAMKLDYLYSRRSPQVLEFDKPTGTFKRREMPKLRLSLPQLCVDRAKLTEEVPSLRQREAGQDKPWADIEHGQEMMNRELSSLPSLQQWGHCLDGKITGDAGEQGVVSPDAERSRENIIKEYMRSMEQFLEAQEQVMSAYLSQRSVLTRKDIRDDAQSEELVRSESTARSMRKRPLIGTVIHKIPGEEIVVRRELDVNEDLFLQHHTLGGKVSKLDKELLGLPVMPLTMSMEMLGEVAAELVPGKVLVGMKNIRADRWIIFEREKEELEVTAERHDEEQFHVSMREAAPGKTSLNLPIIEGTMIFADAYPEAPIAGSFSLRNRRPSRFSEGNLYTTGMFSGPSFQAILSVDEWGEDGSIAAFQTLATDQFFRSIPEPQFITDTILLDAAGQQVSHWNAEHSSERFNVFPYGVEEVRLYGPALAPGKRVESRLRVNTISRNQFRSDIDLIGPDNKLLAQVIGWEDTLFELPDTFYGMLFELTPISLGSEWTAPLAMLNGHDSFECRRVDKFSEELLLGHNKISLNVLAYLVLSRRERTTWHKLNLPDRRRMEWLLGRSAAKDAVSNLLRRKFGIELCPADVEIEVNGYGQPVVNISLPDLSDRIPSVSIAHTNGIAVALAADSSEGVAIGIDIEVPHQVQQGFAEMVFCFEERKLISSLQSEVADEWVLRLWCAKEAVAKAIGIGMGGNPRNVIVRQLDFDKGTAELEVSGELVKISPELSGLRILAYTAIQDGLISGVALYKRRQ